MVRSGKMVKCEAEHHYSAILVTFDDGVTLLIQPDYDQEAFLADCNVKDVDDVEYCPDEYYELGEYDE